MKPYIILLGMVLINLQIKNEWIQGIQNCCQMNLMSQTDAVLKKSFDYTTLTFICVFTFCANIYKNN